MKYRAAWLAAGGLLIALICYLSLIPSPPSPMRFPHADKLEHLAAYAALMGWFCQIYHTPGERLRLALAFTALGAAVEILQGLSGYRTAEFADLLADMAGIALGWLFNLTPQQYLLTRFDARLALFHDRHH